MTKMKVKRNFYINILEQIAIKTKIDIVAWLLLYKKYGLDIFYFLHLMAGQNIKIPSHRTLINIIKEVKTNKELTEDLEIELEEHE